MPPDPFVPGLQMHPERVDTRSTHPREPSKIGRWFALPLNRQTSGVLNRNSAFRKYRRTAVIGWWSPCGQDNVADSVQPLRGCGNLSQLIRGFLCDSSSGLQRFANGAELAFRSAISVANTSLQHGG